MNIITLLLKLLNVMMMESLLQLPNRFSRVLIILPIALKLLMLILKKTFVRSYAIQAMVYQICAYD